MSELAGCVYMVTVLANGKQYIGITKHPSPARRMKDHLRSVQPLGRALRKHGKYKVKILARSKSWDRLCKLEQKYIRLLSTIKPGGYNLTAGGEGHLGYKHTKAARHKMSVALAGNKHLLGHHHSAVTKVKLKAISNLPEHKNACSRALKLKWKEPVWRRKMLRVLRENSYRLANV